MEKTFTVERYGVPNRNNIVFDKESVDKALEDAARRHVPVVLGYGEREVTELDTKDIVGSIARYEGNGAVSITIDDPSLRTLLEGESVPASFSFAGKWIGDIEEGTRDPMIATVDSLESGHLVREGELDE